MKLIVITNLFPNPLEPLRSTFNERQILEMARSAAITVLCPVDWRRVLRFRRAGRHTELRNATMWKVVNVTYPLYLYLPRVGTVLNGFLMFLSLFPAWWRAIRSRPDAVYATWAFPDGFAAVLLARLWRLPVVVKVHGTDVEVLASAPVRRRLAVFALNRADAVIAVSRHLRDQLVSYGVKPHRISIIYNGVDTECFRPRDPDICRMRLGIPRDARIAVYIGNLKADKGSLDLLEAAAPLCRNENLHLYLLGDGPLRRPLEERIAELGLTHRVSLLGRVNHDTVPAWIAAADVVCLPSYHEGVPNVVLESIACGVPVLATRVGGIPEVLTTDAGVLVAPNDREALRSALRDMLGRAWNRSVVAASLTVGPWADNADRVVTLIRSAAGRSDHAAVVH